MIAIHPQNSDEDTYPCPNDLPLGRATSVYSNVNQFVLEKYGSDIFSLHLSFVKNGT